MERRRGPGGAEEVEVEAAAAGGPPISAATAKGGEAVRALGPVPRRGLENFGAVAEGSGEGSVVDEEEGGKKKGEWKCGGCGGRSVSFVYGLVLGKFGVCSDGLKRPK